MQATDETELPILFSVQDGIAWITLNRPHRLNAFSPEMIVRLADCWEEIAQRPDIRVAVVSGVGERAFSVGADLGSLVPLITRARPAADAWDEQVLSNPARARTAFLRDTSVSIPIIAAVRGAAIAGGFELMLAADLRIVADDSTMGLTEVRRGLIPTGGGLTRLSRQVPRALANEILLVGDPISGARAAALGLVNQVVPSAEVVNVAETLARRIAMNGPLAVRMVKEVMAKSDGLRVEEAFAAEDDAARVIFRSQDAKEGARAFVEKRDPRFVGA